MRFNHRRCVAVRGIALLALLGSALGCASRVESISSSEDWMRQHTPAGAVVAQSPAPVASSPGGTLGSLPKQIFADGLPLRNLQIELRQAQQGQGSHSAVSGSGAVVLQPGQVDGSVSVHAQAGSTAGRSQLQQSALVLNGRSVSFSLGQSVPLRIVQVFALNGGLRIIPSTVLIDRASGFNARPVWGGSNSVDVEISTALARGTQQSNTSTTLQIPLNEWITIAQSEDLQTNSTSGILSRSSEQGGSSLQVQMRLTLK